jgi:metal-dependent amidase/aminoacylase/carboxypeptidase family protein
MPDLSGNVALFAVPAEEYIEVEYRVGLRESGQLEFLVGKSELIARGEFDDIDMVMIIHTSSVLGEAKFGVMGTSNGCFVKFIRYHGRAAHAGGAPHDGINALKAATLALAAIDANRETFKDDDHIRVHPIITRGGQAVSSVPADVRMETFVRGRTIEAIKDANLKVDRSLRAGAQAMGARVEILTLPGYMPFSQDRLLNDVFRRNAAALVGNDGVVERGHGTGSTDMGDLSLIMPTCHPYVAGAVGVGHGADYEVVNEVDAVINPAKAMAMATVDLLTNGAAEAKRIKSEFRPAYTKAQYLDLMRGIVSDEVYAGG